MAWLDRAFDAAEEFGKAASKRPPLPDEPVGPPEAADIDPWDAVVFNTYDQATNGVGLDYPTREQMASAPQVAPFVTKRIQQVQMHSRVPTTEYGLGHRILMRDRKEPGSPAARKRAEELQRLIQTCGTLADDKDVFRRDDFHTFLGKYARDSIVHDQRNAEFVPDRTGKPSYFVAVDCSTVRRANPKRIESKTIPGGTTTPRAVPADRPFVQVINGLVVADFGLEQLSFGVRRPRSNIRVRGYGFAELDELVIVVTALLWGLDYNANYFRQGSTTKGLIKIVGNMPREQLRAFRRMWAALVSGVGNAWRTPIVNVPASGGDINWVPLSQSNKDMEWSAFTEWLMFLVSAAWGMDLAEVGGRYQGARGQKAMFESDNEAKVRVSQESGLVPILDGIAGDLNRHFVQRIDPDFEFAFVGLEKMGAQDRVRSDLQRMQYMTINEIRAEHDLEPRPEGDVVANQIAFQAVQQAAAQQQQGGGGPPGGDEGGEGGGGGDPYAAMMWGQQGQPPGQAPVVKGWRRTPTRWSL